MGRAAVVGCGELKIDEAKKTMTVGDKVYHEGDFISLDGSTGKIYGEPIPTTEASISGDFGRFMAWADAARRLTIRTNAYRNYDDVRNQAVSARNQAALYDMEAKNSRTAGILGAFGSTLSSFGNAWANHERLNPPSASPKSS